MSWEKIRRWRLPLHYLRGTWQAVALNHPEGFNSTAQWAATIQLHFLNFSAINGMHSISIVNLDDEDAEFDLGSADLEVDENGQMVSAPFWNLERVFQNKGVIPLETVTRIDNRTLIVTVWHAWDKVTPRTFRLTKLNDDLPE